MKQAYGYVRVSSKGQVEKDGYERQIQVIDEYANGYGYQIVNVYKEQVSGIKDIEERMVFKEMIADILKNGVNTVIVERLDRLAREYRIQESLLVYLASKDIVLINASTGEDVTEAIHSDPMKKALIQMQGVFSELDKNILIKKLRTAREHIRASSKCEGRKSYKELDPDLIAEIKALRRKPRNGKRLSLAKTLEALQVKGFTTATGKQLNITILQNILYKSMRQEP